MTDLDEMFPQEEMNEVTRLRAQLDKAIEALRPFAAKAAEVERYENRVPDEQYECVRAGDLRRAAEVYKELIAGDR